MKSLRCLVLCLLVLAIHACGPASLPAPASTAAPTATVGPSVVATYKCQPTHDDGVSPSYRPNSPVRSIVGRGHVLTGVVLSSVDCQPIAGVKLEFWTDELNQGHPGYARSTLFTDTRGRYRFECNIPDHIHMRISADGYRTIGVNSYHPNGAQQGTLDFVLEPQ